MVETSDLEETVIGTINSDFILPRKSAEVLARNQGIPLTLTAEVREIALLILKANGIEISPEVRRKIKEWRSLDLTKLPLNTGWNIYWAQEMAAAMVEIANKGSYKDYLPGRWAHYNLLVNTVIGELLEGNEGIKGSLILEPGSGSGVGIGILSGLGAIAHGIDISKVGNAFARYLTDYSGGWERLPIHQHLEVYRGRGGNVATLGRSLNLRRVQVSLGNYLNMYNIRDDSFDLVYNSGVAEHLSEEDLIKMIGEMTRVVRGGGKVVIVVPNEESGIFHRRYDEQKDTIRKRYPQIIEIPVDDVRHIHRDIGQYMERSGLVVLKKDGLQIAPSAPIRPGDIQPRDLELFRRLTFIDHHSIDDKIRAWSAIELLGDTKFRLRYGWSEYWVGTKPYSKT